MWGKRFVQRNRRYAFMMTKLEDAERGTRLAICLAFNAHLRRSFFARLR